MYSHFESKTFGQDKRGYGLWHQVFSVRFDYFSTWETRACMMFSCIPTSIQILSDTRNLGIYDVFRYSHFDLMTFQHEKWGHICCLQVFSLRFDYLPTWEMRTYMMSSGIFSSIWLPSDTRNEDMYDVFKFSHFVLNTIPKRKLLWSFPVFVTLFDYVSTYHQAWYLIFWYIQHETVSGKWPSGREVINELLFINDPKILAIQDNEVWQMELYTVCFWYSHLTIRISFWLRETE